VRRCTVLHQAVPAGAPPDEAEVLEAAAAVSRGLQAHGWDVARCPMTTDIAAAEATLRAQNPDLVFNLVESLGGADVLAVAAPALLERLNLHYTGTGLAAIAIAADKRATRRALRRAGILVPPGPEDGFAGPFIVKHATRHASAGLGAHSVAARLPPVPPGHFAEAFIDGREFNLSLLTDTEAGVVALPAAEMSFLDWPADTPRILDYAGKWQPDHPHYQRTLRSFAVAPDLAQRVQRIARDCWHALGLAGYARVDLRLGPDGLAYVIDVNANPSLAEDAGFAAAATQAGIDHATLVARIADAALDPPARPDPAPSRRTLPLSLRRELAGNDDIGGLCRATGFFTPAEIAVAEELVADRRARGPSSDYRFVLADDAGGLAGYACYGPTAGTLESWDLYWIVVHPRDQGSGVGRRLVVAVLDDMRGSGGRRLYAETAGKPLYAPTRAFYAATGFTLQAVVPDFYAPGDAKQIWLKLAG
jgi:D-alanine-D-alanine ligase